MSIELTAIVLQRVTCDLPIFPVPFHLSWKHISDLPLADPSCGGPDLATGGPTEGPVCVVVECSDEEDKPGSCIFLDECDTSDDRLDAVGGPLSKKGSGKSKTSKRLLHHTGKQ